MFCFTRVVSSCTRVISCCVMLQPCCVVLYAFCLVLRRVILVCLVIFVFFCVANLVVFQTRFIFYGCFQQPKSVLKATSEYKYQPSSTDQVTLTLSSVTGIVIQCLVNSLTFTIIIPPTLCLFNVTFFFFFFWFYYHFCYSINSCKSKTHIKSSSILLVTVKNYFEELEIFKAENISGCYVKHLDEIPCNNSDSTLSEMVTGKCSLKQIFSKLLQNYQKTAVLEFPFDQV